MISMRKIISGTLITTFLCLCVEPALAIEEVKSGGELLRDYVECSTSLDNVILDEYEQNNSEELFLINNELREEVVVDDSASQYIYDSHYSGCYIEDEKVYICVTDDIEYGNINSSDLVEYIVVDKSYNDLLNKKSEYEQLYSLLYEEYKDSESEEMELISSIQGFGVDDKFNKIYVDIYNLDSEKIEKFNGIFGECDFLEFRNTENKVEDDASYKPGRAIFFVERVGTTLYDSSASMGYRVKKTLSTGTVQKGFVTCGHGIKDSSSSNIYANSSHTVVIGTKVQSVYYGAVDASFIQLPSGDGIGLYVQYSDSNLSTSNTDKIATDEWAETVYVGNTVCKVGMTTGKTTATVQDTNYSTTMNGVVFSSLTKTSLFCDDGDSGGIVYINRNGKNLVNGIIKGSSSSYSFFVKAKNINDLFGLNIY